MTQKTWIGGTYGLFLAGTNWSPAGVPGPGDDVVIDSANADVAIPGGTRTQYVTVDSVGLLAGDTLSIGSADTLAILGSTVSTNAGLILLTTNTYRFDDLTLAGDFINTGTVLETGTAGAYFDFTGPTATLSGGGTIVLGGQSDDILIAAGVTLDNADNLIAGNGRFVGANATSSLFNSGTIDGYGTAYGLHLNAGNGFLTNNNLIEATGSHGLYLYGTVFNAGGTIAASGSGASLVLDQVYVVGGTLATAGGAILRAGYNFARLDNVVNTGTIVVKLESTSSGFGLGSDFDNQGTVIINGGTTLVADLSLDTPVVTLTGGGTIDLVPAPDGVRVNTFLTAGATLDNVDNLITGSGLLNYSYPNPVSVINSSTIAAAGAGQLLRISSAHGVVNTGLIEATTGSTLSLYGVGTGSMLAGSSVLTNIGGTIAAFGTGAGVDLTEIVTVVGGTLATGNGGFIYVKAGGATLDGSGTHPIAIAAGSTITGAFGTLALLGAIADAGTLSGSEFVSLAGTVEVETGGRVSLGGGLGGGGPGIIALDDGAVASLGSAVAATQTVAFGGVADVLVLSQPGSFAGTLAGFGSTGTIDLTGITATASLAGSVLALFTGATEIGTIALAGFAGGTLAAASDGHGGTDITLQAADTGVKTWIGPAAGAFLTAADWSPAGVPGATDEVIIESGADVTASSPALAVDSLFLTQGNTLSVAGGSFSVSDGATAADPSATSFNAGAITVAGGAFDLAGTLRQTGAIAAGAAGTIGLAPGTDIIGGTIALAGGAIVTSSGATLSGGGMLTLAAAAVVSGSLLDNGDTILGAGSLGSGSLSLINEAAGTIAATGGLLTIDAGAGTIANAGLIAAENFPLTLDAGTLSNGGTIAAIGTVSGPTLTVAAATGVPGTLAGGTWIAASATLAAGGSPLTDIAAAVTLSGSTAAFLSGPAGTRLEQSLLRIDAGGTLDLAAGRVFSTAVPLVNAGTLALAAGGFAATGTASLVNQGLVTGSGAITGSISNTGTIAATAGVLTLGPLTGAGTVLVDGGSLVLTGAAAGGTIDFAGPGALTVDSAGLLSDAVAGLAYNDVIDLANVAAIGSIAFDPVADVLSLYSVSAVSTGAAPKPALAATVTLSGSFATPHFTVRTDSGGRGTDIVLPCFLAGTRLLTTRGEIPVEHLRVGDIAITPGGERPIIWIGDRHVACDRHPRPGLIRPVRVRAGAFGAGRPVRDLMLSPDHAVAWDDLLIPVKHLVNGATVVQERPPHAHYFHVELARHDVVLSDGLWTESYLDTGNRGQFAQAAGWTSLHPDFSAGRTVEAFASLCVAGPRLAAARKHLLTRAAAAGFERAAPVLSVKAADKIIGAIRRQGHLHRFLLPSGTRWATILSGAEGPSDGDDRTLGARIAGIVAGGRRVPLESRALASGFHDWEHDRGGAWRWTDGEAVLELPRMAGPVLLELQVTDIKAGSCVSEQRKQREAQLL